MAKKNTRKSWETKVKKKINELLDKYDLESLIKMGCPKNEYNPEAEIIARLLTFTILESTEKDVCVIISDTFNDQFGNIGIYNPRDPKIVKIAKEFQKWEKTNKVVNDR